MVTATVGAQESKKDDFQIRPVSRDQPLPLSFAQERIWNYSQSERGNATYTHAHVSKLVGTVLEDVLRRCLDYLVRRHEPLRTTFALFRGRPIQLVHPPRQLELSFIDLSLASDQIAALREFVETQKLDLRDGPLVRFALVKIGSDEHWLLRVMHHILFDAWSWNLCLRELAQLYEAFVDGREPPLAEIEPLQYADYAFWQRQFFRAEVQSCKNMISWWTLKLDNPPPDLQLPFKRWTPSHLVDPREGHINTPIPWEVSQRLNEIGRRQKATSFQLGLSIFVAFLAAKTGQRDIIVGSYVTNRKRPELQGMFGDFSNLITLRFHCDFATTLRSWIASVRDTVTEAHAYAQLPYEEQRRAFAVEGKALPEIRVIYGAAVSYPTIDFDGLRLIALEPLRLAMPWSFTFSQDERSHEGKARFDASTYDPGSVRAVLKEWSRFSAAVADNPELSIAEALTACGLA